MHPASTMVLLVNCKTSTISCQGLRHQFGEHNLGWKDLAQLLPPHPPFVHERHLSNIHSSVSKLLLSLVIMQMKWFHDQGLDA